MLFAFIPCALNRGLTVPRVLSPPPIHIYLCSLIVKTSVIKSLKIVTPIFIVLPTCQLVLKFMKVLLSKLPRRSLEHIIYPSLLDHDACKLTALVIGEAL